MKLCRMLKRTVRELATGSTLIVKTTPQGPRVFCADGARLQFLVPRRKARRLIEAGYVAQRGPQQAFRLTEAGLLLLDREAA